MSDRKKAKTIVRMKKLYNIQLIKILPPEFIVLYNGEDR